MYGQATQDGCSLALCISPAQPMPASPIPYSHDWPSYILAPGSSYWLFLSKGQRGACPSASVLDNQWVNLNQLPCNWSSPAPFPCCQVLPATCHTRWGIAPGPCFRYVRSLSTDVSVADSGLFLRSWSWANIGLAGLRVAAQQQGMRKGVQSFRALSRHVSLCSPPRVHQFTMAALRAL